MDGQYLHPLFLRLLARKNRENKGRTKIYGFTIQSSLDFIQVMKLHPAEVKIQWYLRYKIRVILHMCMHAHIYSYVVFEYYEFHGNTASY